LLAAKNCKAGEFDFSCFFMAIIVHLCSLFKIYLSIKKTIMGRGDKKTKKGKIFKGSFGKSRPAKPAKDKKAASTQS
jgi:30S ribosomal protein S31